MKKYLNKKSKILFFFVTVVIVLVFFQSKNNIFTSDISAQSVIDQHQSLIDQQEAQKKEKERILAETKKSIDTIISSKGSVDQKINEVNKKIAEIDKILNQTEADLKNRETELVEKQKILDEKNAQLGEIAVVMYKDFYTGTLELLLSNNKFENTVKLFNYRRFILETQTEQISKVYGEYSLINDAIKSLEQEKELINVKKAAYAEAKSSLDLEKLRIQQEIADKNAYASKLGSDIASLNSSITKLQQELITLKSGSTYVDVNSVPSVSVDKNSTLAGFLNNAPSGYFGVFSFSAYTHRNGMSQYGAKARADNGQNYQQIMGFYYPSGTAKTDYPIMEKITVNNYGEMDFETTYLYGVSEMPPSWNYEALKVQAIAARTYAIRRTANGMSPICETSLCQVYKPRDPNTVPNWKKAVDETKGIILVDSSGRPLSMQYASFHGGWVNNVGWDTTDGTNQSNWTARAWDAIAPHPWFYRAWYRRGQKDSGENCGRMPWMSETEMADIVNAYLVLKNIDLKGTVDVSRIVSVDSPTCSGRAVNPYSHQDMKDLLNIPVTTINGKPTVLQDNKGNTTSLIFSTNRGNVAISGIDFKTTFNLRAPGALRIEPTVSGYAFFNIEKK